MHTNGRILREVDGLFGLITLSLGLHRSLYEPTDFCLALFELLPLLLYLSLEFLDLLTELAYIC